MTDETDDLLGRPILVADDEPANVLLLEKILRRAGYRAVRSTTDARSVLALWRDARPDILLLDLHMPGLTGFEVMDAVRCLDAMQPAGGRTAFTPVLVLTADTTPEAKERALAGGAADFLTKPFDPTEVALRVRNLLATQALHRELADHNRRLERRVRERTAELESARLDELDRLARAAEFRDDDTGQHTRRVGRTAALLAAGLGLPAADVELIHRAAPLHDIGKIGVPDAILLKPGRLTPDEWRVMQAHTTVGARILGASRSALLQLAEEIALTHHENWDGGGYPRGLAGPAIPVAGQIVSVADVFDALTHERPYKQSWPADQAAAEIARLSGTKFAPRVAEAFAKLFAAGEFDTDSVPAPVATPLPSLLGTGVADLSQPSPLR